jgi:hypothetical protein
MAEPYASIPVTFACCYRGPTSIAFHVGRHNQDGIEML